MSSKWLIPIFLHIGPQNAPYTPWLEAAQVEAPLTARSQPRSDLVLFSRTILTEVIIDQGKMPLDSMIVFIPLVVLLTSNR